MTPEELLEAYKVAHSERGCMGGNATLKVKDEIKHLVDLLSAETLLDYGCGKGWQYRDHQCHEYWGTKVYLYDPGYDKYNVKPKGKFDIVIAVDVLEHLHPSTAIQTIREIFSYARKGVFFRIDTKPARKHFKDGTNFHTLQRDRRWWLDILYQLKGNKILEVKFEEEITA